MEFRFVVEQKEKTVNVEEKDGLWTADFGDQVVEAEIVPIAPNTLWINSCGKSFVAYAAENEGRFYAFVAGRQYWITKPASATSRKSGAGGTLKAEEIVGAPMPGLIVKVSVNEGDVVKADQVLVVVESMKMENNIRARGESRVKRLHVKAGDSVNFGSPLVELEPVVL